MKPRSRGRPSKAPLVATVGVLVIAAAGLCLYLALRRPAGAPAAAGRWIPQVGGRSATFVLPATDRFAPLPLGETPKYQVP